jgi:hypothetical protein
MGTADRLTSLQNADGGWGYQQGSSWTEPTAYALMALAAGGARASEPVRRGMEWLKSRQRPDGGWAPQSIVDQSTWVTSLVLLLPDELLTSIDRSRARAWLLSKTGRESGFFHRLRLRMLGVEVSEGQSLDGWPWFPGAAAWVHPTALAILALEKEDRRGGSAEVRKRAEEGRAFLLARRCRDGGWNHGSTRSLGYDSDSYPETTGLALLALHQADRPKVEAGIAAGERHLANCRSAESASWLVLGLAAHARKHPLPNLVQRDRVDDLALAQLAEAAMEGPNAFLN